MGVILIENANIIPACFRQDLNGEAVPPFGEAESLVKAAEGHVIVEGSEILAAERGRFRGRDRLRATEVYDAGGAYLTPSIIEGQCNGLMGCDFSDPLLPPAHIADLAEHLHRWGIGYLLPTIITGAPERMEKCLANLRLAADDRRWYSLTHGGCHVEGPFIGVAGAHPPDQLRDPNLEEYGRWSELVSGKLLVTLDPTRRGAAVFIRHATQSGATCAMSHTDPITDPRRQPNHLADLAAAVEAGCHLAIHLGNAYPASDFGKWHFGYPGWVLSNDAMSATLIADGKHVSATALKGMIRWKGLSRTILWTDMMMATGMPPGEYAISGQRVNVTDAAWLKGQEGKTLAGSIIQPFQAVEFVLRATGLPIDHVWPMVSRNGAVALGLNQQVGSIRPDLLANLLLFDVVDGNIVLHGHLLEGEWVYRTERLDAMAH